MNEQPARFAVLEDLERKMAEAGLVCTAPQITRGGERLWLWTQQPLQGLVGIVWENGDYVGFELAPTEEPST